MCVLHRGAGRSAQAPSGASGKGCRQLLWFLCPSCSSERVSGLLPNPRYMDPLTCGMLETKTQLPVESCCAGPPTPKSLAPRALIPTEMALPLLERVSEVLTELMAPCPQNTLPSRIRTSANKGRHVGRDESEILTLRGGTLTWQWGAASQTPVCLHCGAGLLLAENHPKCGRPRAGNRTKLAMGRS